MVELVTNPIMTSTKETRMDDHKTDLMPRGPSKLVPQGIETFTVCRQHDETGVSGIGVVIEGAVYATGQCVVHWLWPRPRGSVAIFDSFEDFIKVHVKPHRENETIITWDDGKQQVFHGNGNDDIETVTNVLEEPKESKE